MWLEERHLVRSHRTSRYFGDQKGDVEPTMSSRPKCEPKTHKFFHYTTHDSICATQMCIGKILTFVGVQIFCVPIANYSTAP